MVERSPTPALVWHAIGALLGAASHALRGEVPCWDDDERPIEPAGAAGPAPAGEVHP